MRSQICLCTEIVYLATQQDTSSAVARCFIEATMRSPIKGRKKLRLALFQ